MIYLQLAGIQKKYNDDHLLRGVDLQVVKGEKYGLVGPNGTGKTTIIKITLGRVLPDSGTVMLNGQIKVGYVSQEDEIESDYPLFLAMLESYTELLAIKSSMEELETIIAAGSEEDLEKYGELQHEWEVRGGYTLDTTIKNTLIGLGFSEDDFHRPISSFSGGERNRASLAKVLLHSPDLLLLDEPTNHLDIESTIWLENYLQAFDGALIVVSHDRVFLDHVVNKIVELEQGKLELYHGNFTAYCVERAERRRLQLKKYLHQQEEIARIEDFIVRNIAGQKTKQAQSRRKALAKVERLNAPTHDARKAVIKLSASRRAYLSILKIDDLAFAYGDRVLFSDVTFEIERGDRVALIGRNGTGKSTLVKAIIGELEIQDGSIEMGKNVDMEYFDQDLAMLNPDETVLDTVWNLRPQWDAFQLRSHLARFLFFGEDVFKQVKMLSGGEKKKLALAWLLALPANFLILDEPTNHLDIGSREVLEEALREFDGTVLFISHDRFFLDSVATRVLELENAKVLDWRGKYSELVERKNSRSDGGYAGERLQKRDSYKEERRLKNLSTARKRRIKELEDAIAQHESAIAKLKDEQLDERHGADWLKLGELAKEQQRVQELLDNAMWEYYQLLDEEEAANR